jgi:hypothetical protein
VLSCDDLGAVATQANLVQLLRQRYERVRLGLSELPAAKVFECVARPRTR